MNHHSYLQGVCETSKPLLDRVFNSWKTYQVKSGSGIQMFGYRFILKQDEAMWLRIILEPFLAPDSPSNPTDGPNIFVCGFRWDHFTTSPQCNAVRGASADLPGSASYRIDAKLLMLVEKNIRVEKHWSFTFVLTKIAWQVEHFSRWHEGCACHVANIFKESPIPRRQPPLLLTGYPMGSQIAYIQIQIHL